MSCQAKRCCVFLLIANISRTDSVATRRVFSISLFVVLLALVSLTTRVSAAEPTIRIAAASSLQFALGEVIDTYRTVVHDDNTAPNNTVPKNKLFMGHPAISIGRSFRVRHLICSCQPMIPSSINFNSKV